MVINHSDNFSHTNTNRPFDIQFYALSSCANFANKHKDSKQKNVINTLVPFAKTIYKKR